MNANPQPWEQGHSKYLSLAQLLTGTEARDLYSKGAEILTASLQAQPFFKLYKIKVVCTAVSIGSGKAKLAPMYGTVPKYFIVEILFI